MKKYFLFSLVLFFAYTLSAQQATESIITLGKQQCSGFLIDIPNTDVKTADAAFRDKLEVKYHLKASKENGVRAYLNQSFEPFGLANYDIYYTVNEYGKKKNKMTQISLVVCTGNMNAISSQNDSQTADYIKIFLRDFVQYVNIYNIQQQSQKIEEQISNAMKEKTKLENNQKKLEKQISKLNASMDKNSENLKKTDATLEKLNAELEQVKKQLK